ncbi:hypothetical protein Golob_019267 [Gossypium lobatum]|uniref:Uncharacterized protein n=1 Tax=Gossypium lobatum TaxID=34289 RepID=A0A7J8L731_9ROSI|nr:hypothetical protein [Gossypium lobatum]
MERTLFHLFLVLLGFSHIISLNAVSVTSKSSINHTLLSLLFIIVIAEKSSKEGRVFMELNDYPGSGANNRHTPRPQFGRCADC